MSSNDDNRISGSMFNAIFTSPVSYSPQTYTDLDDNDKNHHDSKFNLNPSTIQKAWEIHCRHLPFDEYASNPAIIAIMQEFSFVLDDLPLFKPSTSPAKVWQSNICQRYGRGVGVPNSAPTRAFQKYGLKHSDDSDLQVLPSSILDGLCDRLRMIRRCKRNEKRQRSENNADAFVTEAKQAILTQHSQSKPRNWFVLPMENLSQDQTSVLLQTPRVVIPILECLKCLLFYRRCMKILARSPIFEQVRRDALSLLEDSSIRIPLIPCALRVDPSVMDLSVTGTLPLASLGTMNLDEMVTVKGSVTRFGSIRPRCVAMMFRCSQCGHDQLLSVTSPLLEYPTSCSSGITPTKNKAYNRGYWGRGTGCFRGGKFVPWRGRGGGQNNQNDKVNNNMTGCTSTKFVPIPDQAQCIDARRIRIQESINSSASAYGDGDDGSSGGMNAGGGRFLEIELHGELMEMVAAGDSIVVSGILTSERVGGGVKGGGGANSSAHQLKLDALGVAPARQNNSFSCNDRQVRRSTVGNEDQHESDMVFDNLSASSLDQISFSQETEAQFQELIYNVIGEDKWLEVLSEALFPTIASHALTKRVITLAMVGGTPRGNNVRSNIHVAVFGDPGLGKSQILRSIVNCCERAVYVSGNTVTNVGLTVAINREPKTGEVSFDTGAVMRGDNGFTCIDEIDKAVNEHKSLLEVMEQESLSLTKAGVHIKIPVRTTIIACGNPRHSRFDAARTLCENINVSTALLSRFDFVLVLADDAAGGADKMITAHVLGMHRTNKDRHPLPRSTNDCVPGPRSSNGEYGDYRENFRNTEYHSSNGLLSLSMAAQFVAFAREARKPTLSPGAASLLCRGYLSARRSQFKVSSHNDSSPHVSSRAPAYVPGVDNFEESVKTDDEGDDDDDGVTSAYNDFFRALKSAEGVASNDLPITPRFLQSLVRAADAVAKIHLCDIVTEQHALIALSLMFESRYSRATHSTNGGAFRAGATGRIGKLNRKDKVLLVLQSIMDANGRAFVTADEVEQVCSDEGARNPAAMLKQLHDEGDVLQLSGSRYRLRKT